MSAFTDLGYAIGNGSAAPAVLEGSYIFGRGKWVNLTQDAFGNVTLGTPYSRRTPWYTQTDFNLQHSIKVNKNNEHQVLGFSANFTNLLNQHAITSYWEAFNSNYVGSYLSPGGFNIFNGARFYQAVETGYNAQALVTADGLVKNNLYGQPNLWQTTRHIRLGATFSW